MAKRIPFAKTALVLALGFFILLSAAILLTSADLKTLAELLASHSFGRQVTIGGIRVKWGKPLEFGLDDVHFSNAPWGSDPDMLRFAHLNGTLDPLSLLTGHLRFDNLSLENANLILERNEKGIGNWKSGKEAEIYTPHPDNPDDAASSRRHMPTVLKLSLKNGHITFRTSSNTILKIDLNNVALNAAASDQPLALQVNGAYNEHPVKLSVAAASFDALHATEKPFNADIRAEGGDSIIKLDAQMMDPVNFDDFHSQLDVNSKELGSLVTVLGEEFAASFSTRLSGQLERHGDDWGLKQITGQLGDNAFQGDILLTEGPRRKPDDVHATITFAGLDVDLLRAKMTVHGSASPDFFYASADPDPLLDINFGANVFRQGLFRASDLKAHFHIAPQSRSVDGISFAWLGGNVTGFTQSTATADGNKIVANAKLSQIDIPSLLTMAGMGKALAGKADAHIFLKGLGDNFDAVVKHADGEAIATIKDGLIQTNTLRRAAIDIHALTGKDSDMTPLSCALLVGEVEQGIIVLAPVKVKAESGLLLGGGTIDLRTNNIDFNLKSESNGTFALNLPIHVNGNMGGKLHAGLGSKAEIEKLNAEALQNISRLSPVFKTQATKSGCL